jgi:hypothetical protein
MGDVVNVIPVFGKCKGERREKGERERRKRAAHGVCHPE